MLFSIGERTLLGFSAHGVLGLGLLGRDFLMLSATTTAHNIRCKINFHDTKTMRHHKSNTTSKNNSSVATEEERKLPNTSATTCIKQSVKEREQIKALPMQKRTTVQLLQEQWKYQNNNENAAITLMDRGKW